MHKSIYIVTVVLIFSFSSLTFAETLSESQAEKFATTVGIVYAGMPKKALYEVYTPLTQKDYRKVDDEEWITFSDWTTKESGDLVTFYLKEGKVKGWETDSGKKAVPINTNIKTEEKGSTPFFSFCFGPAWI